MNRSPFRTRGIQSTGARLVQVSPLEDLEEFDDLPDGAEAVSAVVGRNTGWFAATSGDGNGTFS